LVCEALACTNVEKLKPFERKFASGSDEELVLLAALVSCCAHVPLPFVLAFDGVNLQRFELADVEQEPVYTDISPFEAITGVKAVLSLLGNGSLGVIVVSPKLAGDRVADILRDTSW
jgi:hypothetical protein